MSVGFASCGVPSGRLLALPIVGPHGGADAKAIVIAERLATPAVLGAAGLVYVSDDGQLLALLPEELIAALNAN